jgi:hypothetical protein
VKESKTKPQELESVLLELLVRMIKLLPTLKSVGALIMLLSIPPFFFPLGARTGLGAGTGASAGLTLAALLPR